MRVPLSMPFHVFFKGLRREKWIGANNDLYDFELKSFWGLNARVAVLEGLHKLTRDVPVKLRTQISPESDQNMGTFAAAYNGRMLIMMKTRKYDWDYIIDQLYDKNHWKYILDQLYDENKKRE